MKFQTGARGGIGADAQKEKGRGAKLEQEEEAVEAEKGDGLCRGMET